jgi:branched-chain amino acid transport system substrate-binding protein
MKTKIAIFILLSFLICMFAGASISSAGDPGVSDNQILVGAILDQTGRMAFLGKEIHHGAKLYFRYINEKGGVHGRKIKLLVEDDMGQAPRTLAALKKLVGRDKIFCIFTTLGQAATDAVVPYLEEKKIPLIAPFSQNSGLIHPPKRYIFQATVSTEIQGRLIIDFIANQLKKSKTKIGTLVQADIYGEDLMKGLTRQAEKYGIKFVAVEKFKPGAVDFSPQLQRLRRAGVEIIVMVGVVREPAAVLKEVKNMGWPVQVIGPSATSSPAVLMLAGEASEGFISMAIAASLTSDHPGVKLYKELIHKDDPKHRIGFFSQVGFEAAMVFVEGLRATGKDLTRENLITGLEKMKDFNAMGVSLTFGPDDREGGTSSFFLKAVNGKYIPISDWMTVTD